MSRSTNTSPRFAAARRDLRNFAALTLVLTGLAVGVVDASAATLQHAPVALCSAARLLH